MMLVCNALHAVHLIIVLRSTCRRFEHKAISEHVISAPKPLQIRRNGRLPTWKKKGWERGRNQGYQPGRRGRGEGGGGGREGREQDGKRRGMQRETCVIKCGLCNKQDAK